MSFVQKINKKDNLPIILFLLLVVNFVPSFIKNAFTKEPLIQDDSMFDIVCIMIEMIIIFVFYIVNFRELSINKKKTIALIITTIMLFAAQILNLYENKFYFKDILNIGVFFANVLVFYILVYDFKINEKSLIVFLKGIIIWGLISVLWNLVFFRKEILAQIGIIFENFDYSYLDNPKGFFGNRNVLAFFLYIVCIANAVLINLEGKSKKGILIFIVLWFGIWCAHSKTTYVLMLVFFETLVLLEDKFDIKKKIIIGSVIGIFGILGFLNIVGMIPAGLDLEKLAVTKYNMQNFSGRKQVWMAGIDFLKDNPLRCVFGIGKFRSTEVLNINNKIYSHFHNLYLELIMTGGIIELFYVGILFLSVIRKVIKSDLKNIYKKIYIIMYIGYALNICLESYGKFSIGFSDLLCLIFLVSMPLLHTNSIKNEEDN